MVTQAEIIIISVSIGVGAGLIVSFGIFILVRCYLNRASMQENDDEQIASTLPMRTNDVLANMDSSDSSASDSHSTSNRVADSDAFACASGIPKYSYKDIEKATKNFTTIVGKGSFGTVYKAEMSNGAVVAVKVLDSNSRQGEREFKTEVILLSKLHHRNLVNLVGYCIEKGQFMLVYEFMSNGSLANHLYGEGVQGLTWKERVNIALDISQGIKHLHGANPPVIHRDLKSANILLDGSMTAKVSRMFLEINHWLRENLIEIILPVHVADFGLSKEELGLNRRSSGLKGTFGYMDPDYVSTNVITTKSDIYSFGIIIFELITAINPQQGLLEYINLAMIGGEGRADWDEILDKSLVGRCDMEGVQQLADVAYKCLQTIPRKRPAISEITEVISGIKGRRHRHVSTQNGSSLRGRETEAAVLERIQAQQIELGKITAKRDHRLQEKSTELTD